MNYGLYSKWALIYKFDWHVVILLVEVSICGWWLHKKKFTKRIFPSLVNSPLLSKPLQIRLDNMLTPSLPFHHLHIQSFSLLIDIFVVLFGWGSCQSTLWYSIEVQSVLEKTPYFRNIFNFDSWSRYTVVDSYCCDLKPRTR